jgi:hypothetical protein
MILSKGLCFFGAKVSSFRFRGSLPVYNNVSLISFAGLTSLKTLHLESKGAVALIHRAAESNLSRGTLQGVLRS